MAVEVPHEYGAVLPGAYTARKFWVVPIVAVVIGIATLITTFVMFDAYDRDFGGIDFPYISDTGRRFPERYAFITGLSILAAFDIAIHVVLYKWLREYASRQMSRNAAGVGLGFVVVAAVFLVLLSIFDNGDDETTHSVSAFIFFVFTLIANTIFFAIYFREHSESYYARGSQVVKYILLVLTWIFFLIFLPIGYAVGEWHYDEERDNFDYRDDIAFNELRAVSEFLMTLFFLFFVGSWAFDFFHAEHITRVAKHPAAFSDARTHAYYTQPGTMPPAAEPLPVSHV